MITLTAKSLSTEDIQKVHKWLKDEYYINTARLRREFSDVFPLAEMMKWDYPRLIDMNNYPKYSRVQLKIVNWETFNNKVLKKLNLCLSRELMENIAAGAPGAVEILLYEIRLLKRNHEALERQNEMLKQERIREENDEIKTILVNQVVGGAIVQVPQKMILYSLYEKIVQDNKEKDIFIKLIRLRMERLENQIKMKTERINDLLRKTDNPMGPEQMTGDDCESSTSDTKSYKTLLEAPLPPNFRGPVDFED